MPGPRAGHDHIGGREQAAVGAHQPTGSGGRERFTVGTGCGDRKKNQNWEFQLVPKTESLNY